MRGVHWAVAVVARNTSSVVCQVLRVLRARALIVCNVLVLIVNTCVIMYAKMLVF